MDSLLRCWRDEVLPHYLDKYEEEHENSVLRFTRLRREALPPWAAGRPWPLIQKVLTRDQASEKESIIITPFISIAGMTKSI